MEKKKTKRCVSKYKYEYNIYGLAEIDSYEVEIDEIVCADGPDQAFLFLAQRFKREGKEELEEGEEKTVFLGGCDIVRTRTLSPDKHNEEIKQVQLRLFNIPRAS